MKIASRYITQSDDIVVITLTIDMTDGTLGDIHSVIEDVEQKLSWRTDWNMKKRQDMEVEQARKAKEVAIATAKQFLKENGE